MRVIPTNTATAALRRLDFTLVDATDLVTPEDITVTSVKGNISIDGATDVPSTNDIVKVDGAAGEYYLELTQTEINITAGAAGVVWLQPTGCAKVRIRFQIGPSGIFSSTVDLADGGLTSAKIADGAFTSAKFADAFLTAAKIADNALTAAKAAADLITEIQSGLSTLTQAQVRAVRDEMLGSYTIESTGTTTTNLVVKTGPTLAVNEYKGGIVKFKMDTTTAALRGTSARILSNTTTAIVLVTADALPVTPAEDDSFWVL